MLPEELKKGDRLTADWLNRLVREEVARTLSAGPGIRISRTPSGSTISATGHSARAAAAPAESDFPWRVSATADGAGGATLNMSPGALIVDTASGPSMITGISLGSTYGNISTGGYVIVRYNTSGSAAATFGASIPANTSNYNYLPVAKITKTGNDYAVTQYMAGAFFAFSAVDEEV